MQYNLVNVASGPMLSTFTRTYPGTRETVDDGSENRALFPSREGVSVEGATCTYDNPEEQLRPNLSTAINQPTIATQVFATLVMGLMQLSVGVAMAFSGITLPQLTNPDAGDLLLTPLQQALYGSFLFLGSVLGCVAGVPLVMSLGHRVTQLLSLLVAVAFWLLLAFSPSVWVLLTSRLLLGFPLGSLAASITVYVIEIAHQDIRGTLFGFTLLARQVGFLLTSVVGLSNLSWRQMGFLYSGMTGIPIFGLLFLPNSPRWLVTRGRVSDAQKALIFFRGKHYDFNSELKAITDQMENTSGCTTTYWQQIRGITEPSVYRIFGLMVFFCFVSGFDGNYSLMTYLVTIFQTMETSLNPYTCSIIFCTVRGIGTFLFICLTDRLGRRPLIIVSYCVCAVCMAACGGYFYMQESGSAPGLEWLPLSTVFIFIFFNCIGLPVIIVLASELMPTPFRNIGSPALNLITAIGMFAASMTYPATAEALGEHGAFWLFSVVCGMLALVSALTLPETRGRSLEEISDHHKDQRYTIVNDQKSIIKHAKQENSNRAV